MFKERIDTRSTSLSTKPSAYTRIRAAKGGDND